MSKPKTREELLERLESWAACYDAEIGFEKDDEQAQKQIIEIIQNQSEVTKEFIEKWAVHMSIASFYDADEQKKGKIGITAHPNVRTQIVKMFKEVGYNVVKKREITMKDLRGWADEIRERVTNHEDWGYVADTIKNMVEEEFGIKVKK